MKLTINVVLVWLFRIFILGTVALMVVSFVQPWWVGKVNALESINIYGWGLRHNLSSLAGYVASDVTPVWQVALAWTYFGLSVVLALFGALIKQMWGSLMIGVVGMGYIAYAATAINVVVKNRLAGFYIPLEGSTVLGEGYYLNSALQMGYYFAYVAGGLMVLLAIIKGLMNKRKILLGI